MILLFRLRLTVQTLCFHFIHCGQIYLFVLRFRSLADKKRIAYRTTEASEYSAFVMSRANKEMR